MGTPKVTRDDGVISALTPTKTLSLKNCSRARIALRKTKRYSARVAIDPESVGYESAPVTYSYGWRDTVLYALGVGAKPEEELDFLYEGRGPKVIPSFATAPTFSVFDVLVDRIGCDRTGMVHERQRLWFHKPLPPEAALRVVGRVSGLYDLKRMAIARLMIEAYAEDSEEALAAAEVSLLLRNDGGFGGERPPREERVSIPDRTADFEVQDTVSESQAALYRLNGDYNPLHIDPDFAAQAGFDQPILHGLGTLGFACRAVVHEACGGDPTVVKSLQGQFRAPVFPGDTLVIRGWREGSRVLLQVATTERPEDACLTQAYAEIAP